MKRFKLVLLAVVTALVLTLGGAAFAATASGEIVGLADVYTLGAIRPNTYTADTNGYGES
jgi:hypothetical protein